MKKLQFITLALIGIAAYAQPVIPASHVLQDGTFTYSYADSQTLGGLTPGPEGANQTWDFSGYQSVGITSQVNEGCPGNPNCADFPAANRISIVTAPGGSTTSYTYFTFANNQYFTIGSKNVQSNGSVEKYFYDDTQLNGNYPITYQQTYTDTWATHSDPAGYDSSGSQTVTVDGYGTLITPLGTFTNVLRIKTVMTIVQSVPGLPPFTTNSTVYSWTSPTIKGTLLLITFNDILFPDVPPAHTRSLAFGNNGALATSESDLDKSIEIYPNPSSDFINLKSTEAFVKTEISNVEGRIVLKADKTNKINISKLRSGVYFLKAELENGKSVTKKFIKK